MLRRNIKLNLNHLRVGIFRRIAYTSLVENMRTNKLGLSPVIKWETLDQFKYVFLIFFTLNYNQKYLTRILTTLLSDLFTLIS